MRKGSPSRLSERHYTLLASLLALFSVSSTVSVIGIFGPLYMYGSPSTFAAGIGLRTLGHHMMILFLRWHDIGVLQHGLNITTQIAVSVVWFGGAIWSQYFEADIWGYKLCAGCHSWMLLGKFGGLIAAVESAMLIICAVLCIQLRASGCEDENMLISIP